MFKIYLNTHKIKFRPGTQETLTKLRFPKFVEMDGEIV